MLDEEHDIKDNQAPLKSYLKVNRELGTEYKYELDDRGGLANRKQISKIYASLPKNCKRADKAEEIIHKVEKRNAFTKERGY